MFKLLTTKNFILLKNDKIYQTTKVIDLVLSGRTGTKLKIFQLFVKIVMFYYILIIFKRQKKWTILFLWFFTWYCLIVSRETFIVGIGRLRGYFVAFCFTWNNIKSAVFVAIVLRIVSARALLGKWTFIFNLMIVKTLAMRTYVDRCWYKCYLV